MTVRHATSVGRLAWRAARTAPVDGSHVVAVDLEDAPAVRLPVRDDVLRHDVRVASGKLFAVPVEDGHEVRQAVARGEAARLRGLALLLLAVSHPAEHARAVPLDLRREREAHGSREALPEVARAPVDARHVPLDVPLERRAAAAEAHEGQGRVEVPEPRERRVRAGRDVPVADHDAVSILLEGILRVAVPEAPEDQQELERRHRAAGVPRGGERRHLQDVAARGGPERRELRGLCVRAARRRRSCRGSRFHSRGGLHGLGAARLDRREKLVVGLREEDDAVFLQLFAHGFDVDPDGTKVVERLLRLGDALPRRCLPASGRARGGPRASFRASCSPCRGR